jgi:hypothetical protein
MRKYSYRAPASPASPAGRAMYEAIELATEEKSPFPDRSTFIDAGTPETDREIKSAAEEGQSAVVVSADGSAHVLSPEQVLGPGAADAA